MNRGMPRLKDEQTNVRAEPGTKKRWMEAAKLAKRNLSDWIRVTLDEAADRQIAASKKRGRSK